MDISNYNNTRQIAESFFKRIISVRCPALNHEVVSFNNDGFRHLMYKGNRKRVERDKSVQVMKFKLLSKAKKLIELSTTYQEYDEGIIEVIKKKAG